MFEVTRALVERGTLRAATLTVVHAGCHLCLAFDYPKSVPLIETIFAQESHLFLLPSGDTYSRKVFPFGISSKSFSFRFSMQDPHNGREEINVIDGAFRCIRLRSRTQYHDEKMFPRVDVHVLSKDSDRLKSSPVDRVARRNRPPKVTIIDQLSPERPAAHE